MPEFPPIPERLSNIQPRSRERSSYSSVSIPGVKNSTGERSLTREDTRYVLSSFFSEKGYSPDAISYLAHLDGANLGNLFTRLVLRHGGTTNSDKAFDDRINVEFLDRYDYYPTGHYQGFPDQNAEIDASIPTGSAIHRLRDLAGKGATRAFDLGSISEFTHPVIKATPIVIVGAGPAGIFAHAALRRLGFDNITVIDSRGKYGGIWNQPNVHEGSKNNPFNISFNSVVVSAAPGDASTITNFLEQIVEREIGRNALPERGKVTSIVPGDLSHIVEYTSQGVVKRTETPIVINATGVGKPLAPSDPDRMITSASDIDLGMRWQKILTDEEAEHYRGKRIIFVGLGNSTMEMMMQLQYWNDRGYNIDYRVLTHYPEEAVINPNRTVSVAGKDWRVSRDLIDSELTKLEYDISESRRAYDNAVGRERILSDIAEWHVKDGILSFRRKNQTRFEEIPYDSMYTLIGYGNDLDSVKNMGMKVIDERVGAIAHDFDGEIQAVPGFLGRYRVHAGYFGLGAVLRHPDHNDNAVVIPGINHRLYDQLFSVAVRAVEYNIRLGKI